MAALWVLFMDNRALFIRTDFLEVHMYDSVRVPSEIVDSDVLYVPRILQTRGFYFKENNQ